ncbi:TadE/TadG family type IV pilus assembly protein [Amphritea balenae]|uniref:Pilus assembly protein n=1 Tax=Amphritea balenae TaxID=452629 RepID=A0A3P1SVP7_9GAMM|nr:TadE/TadG family type IV pilus assembly protein [Amphritea balenae]RRD01180.1 pilus assembly protein [Amphritea balenae]GGK59268.1 hypothetical protein GCM10007941_06870 [Amphritea balenae]
MKHLRNLKHQRGMAIIEFTFTLPLLLFVMFAGAEVGRMLYQYNTLTKSVEDGARYLAGQYRSAVATNTVNTVRSNAVSLVQTGTTVNGQPSLLPGTISVSTQTDAAAPNPVIVTATYTYNPMILPNKIPGFGFWSDVVLAIPLTAQVGMPVL